MNAPFNHPSLFLSACALVLALLVPAAHAQEQPTAAQNPEAGYRAFFEDAPRPEGSEIPEALGPYFAAELFEMMKSEGPGWKKRMLKIAREQRELYETMKIDSLHVASENEGEATLSVRWVPREREVGLRSFRLARVAMREEEGRWKMMNHAFFRGGPKITEATLHGCPRERSYGNPDDANVLTMHSKDGTRTYHFADVAVLDYGDRLQLRFPPYGPPTSMRRNQFTFEVKAFAPGQPEQEIALQWPRYGATSVGCYHWPPFSDEPGTLTVERYEAPGEGDGAGFLKGRFEIVTGEGDAGFSGRVRTDNVTADPWGPVGPGTAYTVFDEQTEAVRGMFIHIPSQKRLSVSLASEGGVSRFVIQDFAGEPGVYSDARAREIYIVHAFADGHIRGETREMPFEEDMPQGPLTAEEAQHIGAFDAKFESDHVITLALPPLDVGSVP